MTDHALIDPHPVGRPYGWVGLPVSLFAILVLGTLLCAGVVALAFAIEIVVLGWHGAVMRAVGLKDAMKGDPQVGEFVALCLSILIYAAVAIVVFAAARWRGGRGWRDLIAWHPWSLRASWRLVSIVAAATLVYSLVANEALAYFYPASQDWVKLPIGALSIGLFFVVATMAAPLTEELIFRGWLFTALRAKLPFSLSLIASSIVFALAHWEATHLYALAVFPVGLALGLIRERVGSLKASIAFHAIYNGLAFATVFFGT